MDRRTFLKTSVSGAAAAALALAGGSKSFGAAAPLQQRVLGKTGVKVPILGYGAAQVGTERTVAEGVQLFQQAYEMGISYFDTAPEFAGYGKSQVQLGHAFKSMRDKVFITTKCARAKGDEAMRLLEQNLKELQSDYADLVYVHSIGGDDMDFKTLTSPGGAMEFLVRAKQQGLARFVGVTGHNRPQRFVDVLRDFDIDVVMNAVNFVDRHTYNFEEKVWPVAAEKQVGLVAMKVFGGSQGTVPKATAKLPVEHHEQALRYALSLPNVSLAILGMKTLDELKRNVEWARNFKPMTPEEIAGLQDLGKQLAAQWKEHLGQVV